MHVVLAILLANIQFVIVANIQFVIVYICFSRGLTFALDRRATPLSGVQNQRCIIPCDTEWVASAHAIIKQGF
jgi:hypothetical protein